MRVSPQYCRKAYWTKMVQNGPNDHFGQNDLTVRAEVITEFSNSRKGGSSKF